MSDKVNRLNRLVNIDPNLQRLRDVSGQLFLTDQQVEQLVNYVQMYMRGVGLSLTDRNDDYGQPLRKSYGTISKIEPTAGIAFKKSVMNDGDFEGLIDLMPRKAGRVDRFVSFLFCSQPIGFVESEYSEDKRFISLPSLVGYYSSKGENGLLDTFWPKVDDNSPIICESGAVQVVLPFDMLGAKVDFSVYVTYIGVNIWFS